MDTLVPSFLSCGGVDFSLNASPLRVGLEKGAEQLEALRYALEEVVNGDSRDVPLERLAREGFHVQGLSALPIPPETSPKHLADSLINWRRLSGSWPELSDSFHVATSFTKRDIVVPRHVLIDLVSRLRMLRDEILTGKREGRVGDAPVPPVRSLTPELEEHDRLRQISQEDAQEYANELYERRA